MSDFDAIWGAVQIRTDDDGRHWDAIGREYRLVVVLGEATYVLIEDGGAE